jgi:hypothetical protein
VKEAFKIRNQLMDKDELDTSKNHPKRPKPWSVEAAKKFNSPVFTVRTLPLPDLHYAFCESQAIKLEDCPGEITPDEVERRVAESQTTLKKIIMKWELSGRGDGEQNDDDEGERNEGDAGFGHIDTETFDFRAGDNRSNFLHIEGKERRPHLLYFWHLMDSNEILSAALDIIDLSVGGDSESAPIAIGIKPSTARKRKQEKAKIKRRERKRRVKQAKLQQGMNNSMQDLARSSRMETMTAALLNVYNVKAKLADRMSDSPEKEEYLKKATKEYLDAMAEMTKEMASPMEESTNIESDEGSCDEDSNEDIVD